MRKVKATPASARKPRPKMTRAEKRRMDAAVAQARRTHSQPATAQETIPYQRMWPDGICLAEDDYYTRTVQFWDINYRLAMDGDQQIIYSAWRDFINFFDSSIHFQLTFLNLPTDAADFEQAIRIPPQGDDFDAIRDEYNSMLQGQLARGNNSLTRCKFITVGIHESSAKAAKQRLEGIGIDVVTRLRRMGVSASVLDGRQRLQLMHNMMCMESSAFDFEWPWLPASGLSTKDFIAPSSFDFREKRAFGMGHKHCAASFLQIAASELKDRALTDLLALDTSMAVSLHIQAIDQAAALKMVRRKLSDLDKSKIDEQKKAIRSGYDMDIMPSTLTAYGAEAQGLMEALSSQNERLFLVTSLVMHTADTPQQLRMAIRQSEGALQPHHCHLVRLDFQQEDGFASLLPLALNRIDIHHALTSSAAAVLIPFMTSELFQRDGHPLYYGLNALSHNLIMADRRRLNNANGVILGSSGSGKSFAAKREILNVFLSTLDDIIICDPEGEYYPLVQRLHGQVIQISAASPHHINPMDIHFSYGNAPISLKSNFLLSLYELIVGGEGGVDPTEKSVLDHAVRNVYHAYLAHPCPENMPILGDLYEELLKNPSPQASHIASCLEIYVTGSLDIFNHRTNVELTNRVVCFDIRQLGSQLKTIGMHIVQDQVWGRISANRAAKRATRYYMDEFHLLLEDQETARYSVEIWKRCRKWGGIPTAITQNVKDLLKSPEIENILENSDFIYMLNQASGDQKILAEKLGISAQQLSYVTGAPAGEGLLFYGNTILPFEDHFPQNTALYRLMNTKPDEAVYVESE